MPPETNFFPQGPTFYRSTMGGKNPPAALSENSLVPALDLSVLTVPVTKEGARPVSAVIE